MKSKTYVVLGGGGSFGVHAAKYLLEHAEPNRVISVGRNPEREPAWTLEVGKGDARYAYHQIHLVHEQDRLFELFDQVRPDVIVCFAAQGEGAVSWKNPGVFSIRMGRPSLKWLRS